MHTSPDCDISVPCQGLIETDRNKAIAQTVARNVRYSLPPLFYKTSFNTAIYMTFIHNFEKGIGPCDTPTREPCCHIYSGVIFRDDGTAGMVQYELEKR